MRMFWMKRHDGKGKAHAFNETGTGRAICGQAYFDQTWRVRIDLQGSTANGPPLENKEMCGYCKHHLGKEKL